MNNFSAATINWQWLHFSALSSQQLYTLLQLRNEVFIVEQNCAYQDIDQQDDKAQHGLGYIGETLACYCRVFPPGIQYPESSIGRILVKKQFRQQRLGKALVQQALTFLQQENPNSPVRIGAQRYLTQFYQSFGFIVQGEPYLEDGIEHIIMLRA